MSNKGRKEAVSPREEAAVVEEVAEKASVFGLKQKKATLSTHV